jgi:hypothetical protein
MSNYQVEPASQPQALTPVTVKALRREQVQGLSRRQILRGSLAGGVLLWLTEVTAGSLGFIWPNLRTGFGAAVTIGTLEDVKAANSGLPIAEGFPAYYADARAFVILIDPATQQFLPARDATGSGEALNVRALYQRCLHLNVRHLCQRNSCSNRYYQAHRLGSRTMPSTDLRLGMHRFFIAVDGKGELTTIPAITGPLVAPGQPADPAQVPDRLHLTDHRPIPDARGDDD